MSKLATILLEGEVNFDTMLGSLNALTSSLGSEQGDLSALLRRGADQWRGQGAQFNAAVRSLSSATGVLGARADDIDAIVDNLTKMMAAFNERQVSLTQLVDDLGLGPGRGRHRADEQADAEGGSIVLGATSGTAMTLWSANAGTTARASSDVVAESVSTSARTG